MFAPYCETCQSRILLGTRSIVHFISPEPGEPGAVRVLLRCVCGGLVDSAATAPNKRGIVPVQVDQVGSPLTAAAS